MILIEACLQGGPTSGNAIQIGRMHSGMVGIYLWLHGWSLFNKQPEVHLGEGQPKRAFL